MGVRVLALRRVDDQTSPTLKPHLIINNPNTIHVQWEGIHLLGWLGLGLEIKSRSGFKSYNRNN